MVCFVELEPSLRPRAPRSAVARPHGLLRGRRAAVAVATVITVAQSLGAGGLPHWLPHVEARAAAEGTVEQVRLPELVRTKHRTFSIPFRLPTAKDADAAPQRVV
ncbi:MAG: hypothetical protein ACKO6B_18335, partial [Planctomycetia bacterium]